MGRVLTPHGRDGVSYSLSSSDTRGRRELNNIALKHTTSKKFVLLAQPARPRGISSSSI